MVMPTTKSKIKDSIFYFLFFIALIRINQTGLEVEAEHLQTHTPPSYLL
jgi:hypothetical protein